MIVTKK